MVIRSRSDIPEEETWDLCQLFDTEEQFYAGIEQADRELAVFKALLEQPVTSPTELASLLQNFDNVVTVSTDICSYAYLKFSEDIMNSDNQARFAKSQMFYDRYMEIASVLSAESGEPLSTDAMKQTSCQVLEEFWGDTVRLDEGADLYWMRQPHYYLGIYAYTYAVGLVASTVLSERIHQEGKSLANDWIAVLRTTGGDHPPIQMFKMLGIDMLSPEPYRQAIQHVARLIDELEANYGSAYQ